ncbi:hypothetical protein SMITH_569 [Smithella sp. ME-1]|uniref:Uncharacterized protein n=1 Tax=hydrocarbon metagenome TaxID=938273 RepID=A0A0W8FPS8_9ZZZZ|nr:hypothetical protein SMITH_569 [Smithella sp. ME-1]
MLRQGEDCILRNREETGDDMKQILTVLAIIAVWYALQAYILPKLGIST